MIQQTFAANGIHEPAEIKSLAFVANGEEELYMLVASIVELMVCIYLQKP